MLWRHYRGDPAQPPGGGGAEPGEFDVERVEGFDGGGVVDLGGEDAARDAGLVHFGRHLIQAASGRLAAGLEQAQEVIGYPLDISSGYRSRELNIAIGGAEKSQHCLGLAADFTCPEFGTPLAIASALRDSGLRFDQCILEFGRWVHLSFSTEPRGRLLTIHDAKEGYLVGLWDTEGNKVG